MNPIPTKAPTHISPNMHHPNVTYQLNGYQIRIHYNGTKTLTQCLKNLVLNRCE